jgi:hypothetical protein
VGFGLRPGDKELLHGVRQGWLIVLQRQNIVRPLLHNRLRNRPLTAHRINGGVLDVDIRLLKF